MYLASVVDEEIEFCFLLSQATRQSSPMKKQALEVFFLSFMFFSQSTPEYSTIIREES